MSKLALITGITGQDGSYLSELLLNKNYKVYGIVRRNSQFFNFLRLEHIKDKLELFYGDLSDSSSIINIINNILKNNKNYDIFEIYNLGAQSHVKISFDTPEYTCDIDGLGTLRILEAIRLLCDLKITKFYQAGTSEMFGEVLETPQTEITPFNPRSPYACSKVFSHNLVINYRKSYGIFACNGILFNHESNRRGDNFVTKKIINSVIKISDLINKKIYSEEKNILVLGNINSKRDWGHAEDYVNGMWLMLQNNSPDDYILASGETYSVREFVEKSFFKFDINIEWFGKNEDEVGYYGDLKLVKIDKKFFRPSEVDLLLGNPSKAINKLGWKRNYDTIDKLIDSMINK